jgi:transcriptional regulator GlxA family with amidase domain
MKTIGVLIFPQFQLLDVAGPVTAFEIAGRMVPGTYDLCLVSRHGGAVASSSGVALDSRPFRIGEDFDTLLISGGDGTRGPAICESTLDFARACARSGRRTASVCSGAYVLAAAGLLDGRRATTHWSRTDHFRRQYPAVRLEPDCIYVHDGPFWTSAGITAGIDLALAMIGEDLGEARLPSKTQTNPVVRRRSRAEASL